MCQKTIASSHKSKSKAKPNIWSSSPSTKPRHGLSPGRYLPSCTGFNWFSTFYFATVGLRSIVMSMSVCLSACLCLSVRSQNSKTARTNFTKFLCMLPVADVARSWDGVAIQTTSCFHTTRPIGRIREDVMFRRSSPYQLDVWQLQCLVEFVRMLQWERSLSSTNALC